MSRPGTAVSRVEEYMRAESRMSQVSKPEQEEGETKARYAWRLIRSCVKQATDIVARADAKELLISHGVHHYRRLHLGCKEAKDIAYNKTTTDFMTLDGESIHIYYSDGRKKDVITPEEPINRLIHATQMNLYLGWVHENQEIFLMDKEFSILSMSEAVGPITALVHNSIIGEVVTVGPGFITSWVFRYGGRHLLPRKTTTAGLTEVDHFTHLVLEETASRTQKGYAACGTSVAVFNLFDGELLCYEKELHTRTITALLFFNPLKYLVTASKDGSIKVWDEKWHLQLVFVGHCSAVTSLACYPHGPLIMSASKDETIRIWSLETCDEVDKVDTNLPVQRLGTVINCDRFCSLSDTHCDLWKVQHVHALHSTIGYTVMNMKSTDHPSYPVRTALLCKDSSVRILSPTTGDIITTLLMNPFKRLKDATYAIADNFLFAVFENGDIVKAYTGTNPCTILDEWKCNNPLKACNYLLVYEYVITASFTGDTWAGMKRAITQKGLGANAGKSADRTLLLGGRKDGKLCVFNWDTGDIEFEIEAHGTRGVLSMIANSKNDQLISAGLDNIIKVWRLYPYAQESLAPLMSFYCAHTPIHMTIMRSKLSVAFQEHTTATYSVVMYNLETRSRHDHGPEDDHMDSITGLSSCAKMRILASCSADGTVRIWNEVNQLIRLIKLNASPVSLCFCSQKGDLLVGIGEHVHKIAYKSYLPKNYRLKQVSMNFHAVKVEKALPFDQDLLEDLSREDTKRLKAARSSFKFTHFMDILTEEEEENVMKEKKTKQQAFDKIGHREQELSLMRDGEIKPRKRSKPTKATKRQAFDKYLKIFYDRPKVELYEEDAYLDDTLTEKDEYKPERGSTGFFPDPAEARKSSTMEEKEETEDTAPAMPIRVGGYVPNSVLVRLLWPQTALDDAKKEDRYIPPGLTAEQLQQIAASNTKKQEEADYREHTMFLDYGDEEEAKKEEDEDEWPLSGRKDKKKSAAAEEEEDEPSMPPAGSGLMDKVAALMAKPPTPVEEEPPEKPAETPKPSPPRTPKEPAKPRKPLVKFVTRPDVPTKVPTPPMPSPPHTPTPPPRPVTPLPDFITQFIGQKWFDKFFPDCSEKTLPKPWTMVAFVSMLLKALHLAEYPFKVEIVHALSMLHKDHGVPNGNAIHLALLTLLGDGQNPPSCLDPHQKAFIVAALDLLQEMGIYNQDFYTELMMQFLEADADVRRQVLDIFRDCGLKDVHGYFPRELDGWDVWHLDDSERPRELRKMCRQWLDKYLSAFKLHLEDTIERLKKGQNVHGKLQPGKKKDSPPGGRPKSILKRPNVGAIDEEDPTKLEGVQMVPGTADSSKTMVTVTFDKPPDPAAIDNATYMEAINYFCDMEMEKEVEKLRAGLAAPSHVSSTPEEKNTVLVLPKLPGRPSLVRLGETHTSKCRPHRETAHFADLRLPPVTLRGHQPAPGQLYGFPSCVNLPLKTIYMNPFPSPLDQIELYGSQPILLTLKSSQKYFVPQRSVVPPDM